LPGFFVGHVGGNSKNLGLEHDHQFAFFGGFGRMREEFADYRDIA
jgi:hypothetical protein